MSIFTISSSKINVGNVFDLQKYFDAENEKTAVSNTVNNVEKFSSNNLGGIDDYFITSAVKNNQTLATYNGSLGFGFAENVKPGDYSKMMLGFNPNTNEDLLSANRRNEINKAQEINRYIKKNSLADAKIKYGDSVVEKSQESVLGISTAFNVDKSISLLYAKADEATQRKIELALMQANAGAIAYAESKGYFRTRVGKGGADVVKGQAAIASFLHFSSRKLDPQLHIHNEIANYVRFKDPKTGEVRTNTLDASQLYKRQKELASIFDIALANELREIGFNDYLKVDFKGYGLQVNGFSNEAIDNASKRRHDILKHLKESNITAGQGSSNDIAALATRDSKQDDEVSSEELRKLWRETLLDEGIKKVDLEVKEESKKLTRLQIEKSLFKTGSVFTEYDLDRVAAQLNLLLERDITEIDKTRIELKKAMGVLDCGVQGDAASREVRYYTTQEMLQLESDLVAYANSASKLEISDFQLTDKQIEQALSEVQAEKGWSLRDEQADALRHAATSHRLALIQGAAGTGKSVSLEVLNRAYSKNGNRVIGLAPSGAAASSLEESAGIKSQTVHSLLINIEKGEEQLKRGDILVVDEAGMLDTRTLHKLASYAEKSGAKLVLVGDAFQLEAVGSAGLFGTLQNTIGAAEIKTIARQKKAEMSAISQAWYDGKPGDALNMMLAGDAGRDLINVEQGEAATKEALLARYEELLQGNQAKNMLILADTNADVDLLNDKARLLYAKSGAINTDESVVFKSKTSPEAPEKELEFSLGDRLMLRENSKNTATQEQIYNGDQGTFEGIAENGNLLFKLDRTNEIVSIDKDYQAVSYAYAMTVHKSQGLTVDHALYLPSEMSNRRAAYVAFTRSRAGAEFFCRAEEEFEDFKNQVANYQTKKTALDAVPGAREQILSSVDDVLLFKQQQPSTLDILNQAGDVLELEKPVQQEQLEVIQGADYRVEARSLTPQKPGQEQPIFEPTKTNTTLGNKDIERMKKVAQEAKKAVGGQNILETLAGVNADEIMLHDNKILFFGTDEKQLKGVAALDAHSLKPLQGLGESSVFKIDGAGDNSKTAVICSSPLEALVRKRNDNFAGEHGRTYIAPLEPLGKVDFRKNTAWEREIHSGNYDLIINAVAHDEESQRTAKYIDTRLEAQGKTSVRSAPASIKGMSGEIATAQSATKVQLKERVELEKPTATDAELTQVVSRLKTEFTKTILAIADESLDKKQAARKQEMKELDKKIEAAGGAWVEVDFSDKQESNQEKSRGRSL